MGGEYLAKDMENQFKSLFFFGEDYDGDFIVIPSIRSVSKIRLNENGEFCFDITIADVIQGAVASNKKFSRTEQIRIRLITQIDEFYRR
jgi:hypothetical protein